MNYGKRKALSMHSSGRSSPRTLGDFDEFEGDGERDNNKRKTRNLSEKRRRDQFNMLINELFSMVSATNRKMDKTTVLKATIAFLRSQNDVIKQCQAHEIKENWKPSFLSNDEFSQLMLEALDGYLLVITQSGTILYASESVTSLLNHLPSDLVNRSAYDFIHLDERMKVYNILSSHKVVGGSGDIADYEKDENQLTFTCHWRCGTVAVSEEPVYELVEIQGTFRKLDTDDCILMSKDDNMQSDAGSSAPEVCFCCTVRLKCSQVIRELSFVDESKKEFTSRHSMEWKFLFLDHRGPTIIGYLPFEVLGTSGYDYYHPNDLHKVAKGHEQLMQTGKGTSCYYRFLTKGQQWIWLQTTYYITYHQWNSKPEFIVCTNTVVNYAEVRADMRGPQGFVLDVEGKRSSNQDSGGGEQDGPSSSSFWLQPSPSRTPTASTKGGESDVVDTTEGKTGKVQPQSSLEIKAEAVAVQPVQRSPEARSNVSEVTVSSPTTPVLYLTPAQRQLQQQLEQKHSELQQAIIRQQEELRSISEQLVLVSHLSGGCIPSTQPMELGIPQPILTQHVYATTATLQGSTSNIMVTSQMPQINMPQSVQQVMSIPMMMLQQQPVLLSNHQPVIATQHVHTQQMQQSPQQMPSQQQQQPPNHN